MKLSEFLKSKGIYIITHSLIAFLTVSMLIVLNPSGGAAFSIFVGLIYIFGAAIPLAAEYRKKSKFYNELLKAFERLDRKNLLAEIVSKPDFFEGALLWDILKSSNKAALEEINAFKYLQEEYREYIEMWVHQIKTPISSSKLIMQNRSDTADELEDEIESIENYVEQVLFYARSNAVEKDYVIKKLSLEKPVFAALKRNSKLIIGASISVSADSLDFEVCSDSKWLEFILSQILINCVKYANEKEPRIDISAVALENCCLLKVSDNGLGIPQNEIPRIFDKGFTGTNGRLRAKSTGMGLYICKKLCERLGITLSAESSPGRGTSLLLVFPKSSMLEVIN